MKIIILTAIAVAVSSSAVKALELGNISAKDIVKMTQEAQITVPEPVRSITTKAAVPPAPLIENVSKVSLKPATVAVLVQAEIITMIGIFDRVGVKAKSENADCSSEQVVIESSVRSFNPAKWSINFDGAKVALTSEEIPSMVAMFGRLNVRAIPQNGIDRVSQVIIKSRVCNLRPAVWTATY
ncbi:MAG: hypothetical protein NTY45_13270 [Elusimicrobia bacterium]|nr:hypothetical protein [Elusimicrobiota bacterium]